MAESIRRGNNFTALRLLLSTMVVFGHFLDLGQTAKGPWPWPFMYATFAVDAFFVVSGFLITMSFDTTPDLRTYCLRRVFRLYPLYLVVILLQAAVMLWVQPEPARLATSAARYILTNAAFANFLQPDIGDFSSGLRHGGINPSLWTLKIEVAFYIVLPLIWLAVRRWGGAVLLGIFFASAAYDWVLRSHGYVEASKQLPGQLQYFVVGIALYKYGRHIQIGGWSVFLPATIAAVLLTLIFGRSLPFGETALPVVYPLLVGLIVFALAFRTPLLDLKRDLSYGVYLLHAPVIQLSVLMKWYQFGVLGLLVTLIVVFALAFATEYGVERPFITLGRLFSAGGPKARALDPGIAGT